MKYLLIAFALMNTLAFAEEIRVSKMSVQAEMDRSFTLKSSHPYPVILDCQSFIQGLHVKSKDSEEFYMLEPYECEDLHSRINSSLWKFQKHCLDVDQNVVSDYSCR